MKKLNVLIFVLMLSMMFFSCAFIEERRNNRNLEQLKRGMTKEEVLNIMGEPLKDEKRYRDPDVWFYYTETKWSDGNATRDECTPLVFKDGRLIGWGKKYYKKRIQKDW